MFDLKKEFEEQLKNGIEVGGRLEPMNEIDTFLSTCTALDYVRDYETNIQMLEKFHNIDISLTKFGMDIKDGSVDFESALSSLNGGLEGTGFTIKDLGLEETMSLESAMLTVESGESWYVRLWKWIKEKINGLYEWFIGLFKSSDARLNQAEAAINKIPSPEKIKSDVAKVKKGFEEKNKELILEANKGLMDVMDIAEKINREIDENKVILDDAIKFMEELTKEAELKLNNNYPVYWKDVKNIPGAALITNSSRDFFSVLHKHEGKVFDALSTIHKLYGNVTFQRFANFDGKIITKDMLEPEVKKIIDYIKKLDNKSPYSDIFDIPDSNKNGTHLTTFIAGKNAETISTMAYKIDNDGVPSVIEETFKTKKSFSDDFKITTTVYKEAYSMGIDVKSEIVDARKQKAMMSKNLKETIKIYEKGLKDMETNGSLDRDAFSLYSSTLKSGLSSLRFEIKFLVARVNTAILLTRFFLAFIKANTVKL